MNLCTKSTVSQKLKIGILIFHSFQDIAQHFGPTKNNIRVCMSLTRTEPIYVYIYIYIYKHEVLYFNK